MMFFESVIRKSYRQATVPGMLSAFVLTFFATGVLFTGCKTEQKSTGTPAQETSRTAGQKELKRVNIEDVGRMIIAHWTGEENDSGQHSEFEILLRDTDGRNEKLLAKRYFFRFSDHDLLPYKEKTSILYIGKPHIDSAEGIWQFDYVNNVDRQLVKAEIGMGKLHFSKERDRLFYITGGDWYVYAFATGKAKLHYEVGSSSRGGSTINSEGTLIGGRTFTSIFIEDVKTKKRFEWPVAGDTTKIGHVSFSKNLKHVFYEVIYKNGAFYGTFYAPLIPDGELNSQKLSQSKEICKGAVISYLTKDGSYLYVKCFFNMYRLRIADGKLEQLPFFRGTNNYYHLIED